MPEGPEGLPEGSEGVLKEFQGPSDGQLRGDKYGGMDWQTEFFPILRRGPGLAGGGWVVVG